MICRSTVLFQSTLPAKGATMNAGDVMAMIQFQSTLPAKGATQGSHRAGSCHPGFNPRSPRRERHESIGLVLQGVQFQSTLPAKGATARRSGCILRNVFQSTLPAKGATFSWIKLALHGTVSIHAPREGSDVCMPGFGRCSASRFQSTLPAKGAT